MENCIRWRNCLSIIQKCSLFGLLVDGGILKWNEFTINDAVKFSFKKDSANESLIQDTVYFNFPSFHFEKHFSPLFPAQVQKLYCQFQVYAVIVKYCFFNVGLYKNAVSIISNGFLQIIHKTDSTMKIVDCVFCEFSNLTGMLVLQRKVTVELFRNTTN